MAKSLDWDLVNALPTSNEPPTLPHSMGRL
jgi:hypothetical protein